MDRVPLLTGTQGLRQGDRFTVTAEGLLVGRDLSCTVRIDDAGVSREHARVFLHNASIWVQDAGSRNGVYVNGKRILRPKTVSPGDDIRVGDHSFTIELVEPGQEPGELPPPPRDGLQSSPTLDSGATQEMSALQPPGAPKGVVALAILFIMLTGLGVALAIR